MTRSELVALMPGYGPPAPPDGSTIIRTDSHAAVLVKARLFPHTRRATVLRAAAGRARLLETLMPHGTVLPVMPGQRMRGRDIARLVTANFPTLERLARRLAGASQYQVTVRWNGAGPGGRHGPTDDLTDVRTPDAVIAATLRAHVAGRLAATGAEVAHLPVAGDLVSNAVILLDDGNVSALDAALADIDAEWSGDLAIRMIGPYPAVSFASLAFDRRERPEILAAQAALGLRPGFSEDALRNARRDALMGAGPQDRERLRIQAELLACVARLGAPVAPVHVARIWSEGMSSASGTVARAA